MPLYRCQHVLPMFTNIPTDVMVNQFHFLNDTLDHETVAAEAATRLSAFYLGAYGSAGSTRVAYLSWNTAVLRVFDLSDPTPRIPVEVPMGYTSGTAVSQVPTEVACVLSWQAAPQSGVVFQRLHNRCFLGGLTTSMMEPSSGIAFPRFTTSFINAVAAAADTLLGANDGVTDWVQVSQAGGVTAVRPIVGGWVDNGPDTQRRRGVLASTRTLFP